jgi:DNA-binding transcriptional LysR family regulator
VRDLNEVYVFAMVVGQSGFSAAARTLGLPKSSISRYVGRLERRLGTRLLERSTRSIRLTDAGHAFYARCKETLAELDAAEAELAGQATSPSGIIRISCPTGISQTVLARVIPAFLKKYTAVRVHIRVTSEPVSLVDDRVDIAIRARVHLKDENATVRKLFTSWHIFVASPAFIEAHALPKDPAAAVRLPMLSFQENADRPRWRLLGPNKDLRHVSCDPILWSSDLSIIFEAAVAGIGIALVPAELAGPYLQDGRLKRILSEWRSEDVTVHFVFRAGHGLRPAVRVLVDHLVRHTRMFTVP